MGYAQLSLQDKTWGFAFLIKGFSVIHSSRIKGDKKNHLQAKNCSREPPFWCGTSQKTRLWGSKEDVSIHRQGPGKRGEGRLFDYSCQTERETPQPPAKRLSANYSTPPSEDLKLLACHAAQETISDGGYEEATSGFLPEIQGVEVGRLTECNVQRWKHVLADQG
ncbi:hypothetical protein E2C01_027973 [Portunus trituberculatus]|uniref:Uncharacterized protein n=1 Tax=Portunus trituberculatus TaxID=210409 RepID=A0A5B7EN31_PORTR|nr:hypothetical protein [Portunus trituberculatus]